MKVQIDSLDNGSGMNSTLRIYKHHFRDMFETKPYCDIDESDFIECCKNPDKAMEMLEKGKTVFEVNRAQIDHLSIRLYPSY